MAHILKALVGETSTTTGTGALTLAAALTDHRRFSAVCSVSDTTEVMVRHATDGSWAHCRATYSAADELTLTETVESSTGGAISWAAGDKTVVVTPLASGLGRLDLIATKATPVDADKLGLWDSVGGALKAVTWANVKATLKTYFDTLYPSGSGTSTGTNTGDNAVNTLYSGLVSNATHTGDATGATALTVVKINGTQLSTLATGLLKNTTGTGVPSIAAAGTDYIAPSGALGTPSSGTLTNCTADGTNAVGYKHIPQNSKSTAYTLVLADSGKHILHPSADTTARTMTIPANASVAYPIGTALTFVNQASAGVMTIAITTDTMRLAGAGTTGSRTLGANGTATAIKLTATEWIISGTGLT